MKLYIVHVGFYDPEIGMYELHSNMLVVAEDARAAKQQIKNKKEFINRKMHIDGIQEIDTVDGYDVKLEKNLTQQNKSTTLGYDAAKALG